MRFLKPVLCSIISCGLGLGTLGFLIIGLMDVGSTTGFGSTGTTSGVIGLMLCATHIVGFRVLAKGLFPLLIATGTGLIVLSLIFMYFSPIRFGSFFGYGDPAQMMALLSTVTGGLMMALATLDAVTRDWSL